MGIIGNVIAQGIAGGVEGVGMGGADAAKMWGAAEWEKEKQAAIAAREESLARLNNQFASERQEAGFRHTEGMQERGFRHAENLQESGFRHSENLQTAQQKWQGEQNSLQRNLTREQIASHEKIASANNATALQIAKIGGSVTTDNEGNVLWVGKDGKASAIADPNNPGKNLKTAKDLTPAAKAYLDSIKAQLVDLDRLEVNAVGDQTQLAKISDRRAKLTAEQLNVLTGGIAAIGKPSELPTPTDQDIALLKKNPTAKAIFDKKFGTGSANKVLGTAKGAQPKTAAPKSAEASDAIPKEFLGPNGEYIGKQPGGPGIGEVAGGMLESVRRDEAERRKKFLLERARSGSMTVGEKEEAKKLGLIK